MVDRKTKVTENIKLIRLQRSLKQQAVQIATLQALIKSSNENQKALKEELCRANNENGNNMKTYCVHLLLCKSYQLIQFN